MQKILILIATMSLLAGCGGGGGLTSSSSSSSSSSGSGSSGTGSSSTTPSNVVSVIVDQGPSTYQSAGYASVNTLFVTVTVCVPGYTDSSHCQTIDHVQVDTGSEGLRVLSSVLTVGVGSTGGFQYATATGGGVLAECTQYVDGSAWGPLVTADLYVGGAGGAGNGEKAAGVPMQVIGTSAYSMPSACPGPAENTVTAFGANGIIGVGSFEQDCGDGCGSVAANGLYYACTSSSSCTESTATLSQQANNPVSAFSTDNNGVIISLPGVGSTGSATVSGTLTFGIGTQSNNTQSNTATVLWLDPNYAEFTTSFVASSSALESYIDSGSNSLYFTDSSIATCTTSTDVAYNFFCPATTQSESATLSTYSGTGAGSGGSSNAAVSFSVANAHNLFTNDPTYAAFSNLAAPSSSGSTSTTSSSVANTFDWGLPFFYGLNVFTSIQPSSTPNASPYVAYVSNSNTVLN